jgi:Spy/CpxP family protein refolding chaperone
MKLCLIKRMQSLNLMVVSFCALIYLAPYQKVLAQEEGAKSADATVTGQTTSPPNRLQLFQALNLTREQQKQIRLIRRDVMPQLRIANQRVQQARESLDRAIYIEDANEALIEQRVQELSEAQKEAIRLRSLIELRIRRILTPDQLVTLRNLREKAALQKKSQQVLRPNSFLLRPGVKGNNRRRIQ